MDIYNLRFADDIDLITGTLDELQLITNKLYISSAAYGMAISQEKSKVMVNERDQVELPIEITMGRKILETVDKFKYLGVTFTKDGKSESDIKIRMATAKSSLVRLKTILKSNKISIQTKIFLYKSLVLYIMLYGCETWTLTEAIERIIIAFGTKSYRHIHGISYREHKTNVFLYNTIEDIVGKT